MAIRTEYLIKCDRCGFEAPLTSEEGLSQWNQKETLRLRPNGWIRLKLEGIGGGKVGQEATAWDQPMPSGDLCPSCTSKLLAFLEGKVTK